MYLFNLYSHDDNIYLKNMKGKLDINKYASMFGERVMIQFKHIVNDPKRLQKFIEIAYVDLKLEIRATIDVITDKDIAFYIINHPTYEFLYYYFNIEHDKFYDKVDAFRSIIKQPKPTIINTRKTMCP